MISERALARAVEQGIVSAEQAEKLRGLERQFGVPEPVDDEKLRFITGFGDIFVTIGIALFLGSLSYFGVGAGLSAMSAVIAAASWLLAEFFTRRRRMALPSIVLLLTYAVAIFSLFFLLGETAIGVRQTDSLAALNTRPDLGQPLVLIGASLITALAVALHYARFRVPITIAVGVAALVWTSIGVLFVFAPNMTLGHADIVFLICGLAVFGLAMRFDMSDPARQTRRTDIAFWLHFLAAPMIVHSLFGGFIWRGSAFDTATAVTVLAAFLGLGIVAVLVDRRAILVSGLAYAGIACSILLRQTNFTSSTFPATLMLLGAFVLLLSAGWRPLRGAFLSLLPQALARRLPNPGSALSS